MVEILFSCSKKLIYIILENLHTKNYNVAGKDCVETVA